MLAYRIVKTNPPTLNDFLSHRARALRAPPLRADARTLDVWEGVSVFATVEQARLNARSFPRLGTFIGVLDVPEGGPIRAERTGRAEGHWALWGEPTDLFACVLEIVPA